MAERVVEDDEPVLLTKAPELSGHVYFIRVNQYVKIGFAQDYVSRLRHIQTASPYPVWLLHAHPSTGRLETILHVRFSRYRYRGEWFRLSPEIKEHIAMLKRSLEASDG